MSSNLDPDDEDMLRQVQRFITRHAVFLHYFRIVFWTSILYALWWDFVR